MDPFLRKEEFKEIHFKYEEISLVIISLRDTVCCLTAESVKRNKLRPFEEEGILSPEHLQT